MPKHDNLQVYDRDTGKHLCWSCKDEPGEGPFCEHCVKIQPVEALGGYFDVFGLDKTFVIDTAKLKKQFIELSRKFHPDFYIGKSDEERELAGSNSAYINSALKTLSDPMKRAEYLLHRVAGGFTANPSPPRELFEEILEIGELLMEDDLSNEDRSRLQEAQAEFTARHDALLASLEGLFDTLLAGDMTVKSDIESRLNNIKYLKTILGRIGARLSEEQ